MINDGFGSAVVVSGATARAPPLSGRLTPTELATANVLLVPRLNDAGGIDDEEATSLQNFTRNGGVVILGLDDGAAEVSWLTAFGFTNYATTSPPCCNFQSSLTDFFEAPSLVADVSRLYLGNPIITFDAPDDAVVLATWSGRPVVAVIERFHGGRGKREAHAVSDAGW